MIVVNIENLGIGESIHVEDLKVADGVRVLNMPDQTVVSITSIKEAAEETETEEERDAEVEEAAEEEES